MSKELNYQQNIINIQNIVNEIFVDIYNEAFKATSCIKCGSSQIFINDKNDSIYKCRDCNISFSPLTNSLYQKIRYSNDKWNKILTCMISDFTLEETIKYVQSNAETIQRKWFKIYESVNWEKYNVQVRDKPTKYIYANFEVILN